jgi:hypothetical protein
MLWHYQTKSGSLRQCDAGNVFDVVSRWGSEGRQSWCSFIEAAHWYDSICRKASPVLKPSGGIKRLSDCILRHTASRRRSHFSAGSYPHVVRTVTSPEVSGAVPMATLHEVLISPSGSGRDPYNRIKTPLLALFGPYARQQVVTDNCKR